MTERLPVLVVGAGQAGLALSQCLTERGIEHLVLEQADRIAPVWSQQRWDSFTLVSPNWSIQLPGMPYQGPDPDGFIGRDEIVQYLERYAASFNPPVRLGTRVTAIDPHDSGSGYLVTTDRGAYRADNVVLASGLFQQPRVPNWSADLSPDVLQLHTSQYRRPDALPEGAVLVVGSAQSGCQIAQDLMLAGRKVYLSVGRSNRAPRRYRGRDLFSWLVQSGFFDRTVAALPAPGARFISSPLISGREGGRSLSLHQFARDGVTLLGHVVGGAGDTLHLAPDLHQSLTQAEMFATNVRKVVDGFVERSGMDAPLSDEDQQPESGDGFAAEPLERLNLREEHVSTIIWGSGYRFDFSLVHLPVLDAGGFPSQDDGATAFAGLYFHGMPWLPKMKSGLLFGAAEDAERLASRLHDRVRNGG